MDMEQLYSGRILDLAANISHTERLAAPDATATAHSKLCGSTVTVEITVRDGVITGFGQDVRACLLGQTSAAIAGNQIIGTPAEEFRQVAAQMRRMLKENGPPPGGKWADLAILEQVRHYRARHASTLLVFDAVEAALADIERRASVPAAE
jgi:NifU-like protein involved in Fe-S cluster formation